MRRPSRRRLAQIVDVVLPLAVGVFIALVAFDDVEREGWSALHALVMASAVVQGGALCWRRRHPWPVLAVCLAGSLLLLVAYPDTVVPASALVAVEALAAVRPPRTSLFGLAALEGVLLANFNGVVTVDDARFMMGVAVGAWALGEARRSRRTALAETARLAVAEEQARIARELHDVIAHSVSVIVVQAGAADDVFETRPDLARAALRSIDRAGRDALAELRRLLSAVRPEGEAEPVEPQPGLDRLDELAAPLRAGGLTVVLRREGTPAPLPAGVDLSAYRIVQEALTNTLRHADATRAEVTVRYRADAVELDVRDDGRGPAGAAVSGGQGLLGMRERAALLGGTLDAGAGPGGGYRVRARLPLGGAP